MVGPILPKALQKDRDVGETKKKIYDLLIEGATSGLTDDALYSFVTKKVPKANSKRIVRAGFMALSDPALTDRNILNVIYALAIKHRLAGGPEEDGEEPDTSTEMTSVSSSKAASLPLPDKKRKKP
jgi:hypothetical protein